MDRFCEGCLAGATGQALFAIVQRAERCSAQASNLDSSQTSRHVREVPILLQKSKFERLRKSREIRFLDASAACKAL
jgi:hypothetical protein